MADYLGIQSDGELYSAPEERRFIEYYKSNWATIMSHAYYKSENIDMGHNLRPRLVYWGFLAGTTNSLSRRQLDSVAKVSVCVELIHKASLLLDDYIDKDTMRHGKASFYMTNGVEKTIMFTIQLLCMALRQLTDTFYEFSTGTSFYYKSMISLLEMLYNMTIGVLMELELSEVDFQNIERIREIMNLETSSLIQNSILLGYYLSGDNVKEIEVVLKHIGSKLGYAFQVLNDLEPLCSSENESHKGSINTDISRKRKNICYSVLYGMLSKREKLDIASSDTNFLYYFNKYNIKEILISDIHNMLLETKEELKYMDEIIRRDNWSFQFYQFLTSIITVFENRLN